MLELRGVSKRFGATEALAPTDLVVPRGRTVALIGPSGCGKTTLLRLTAGLIAADEGRITIEGTQVTAPRKDACMVFQNFGLLPWRTVLGNVEFPLEIDGVGTGERRRSDAQQVQAGRRQGWRNHHHR